MDVKAKTQTSTAWGTQVFPQLEWMCLKTNVPGEEKSGQHRLGKTTSARCASQVGCSFRHMSSRGSPGEPPRPGHRKFLGLAAAVS